MRLQDFAKLTPKSMTIGLLEAQGDNTTTKALKLTIEQVDGDYSPSIISFRGYLGIIWRSPGQDWICMIIDSKLNEGEFYHPWGCKTKHEALTYLRSHLAQCAWDGIEERSPLIQNYWDQLQFSNWARFQKRLESLRHPVWWKRALSAISSLF